MKTRQNHKRDFTSVKKRLMSLFLSAVMVLGLVPASVVPAFAAETAPPEIKLVEADYGSGGLHTYTSPNGLGLCTLHWFSMSTGGPDKTVGFCGDHSKYMGTLLNGKTWDDPQPFTNEAARVFLDWYYHNLAKCEDIDRQYPNWTEQQKAEKFGYGYWGQWTRQWVNAWVQAVVWLAINGKIDAPLDDNELKMCAAELAPPRKAPLAPPGSYRTGSALLWIVSASQHPKQSSILGFVPHTLSATHPEFLYVLLASYRPYTTKSPPVSALYYESFDPATPQQG